MEPKEKQRIYAQTFVPSVERFDDNHSLIQLASKAKDKVTEAITSKPAYKHVLSKKSLSNFSPPLTTGIVKSPDNVNALDKQTQESLPERNFHKNGGNKIIGNSETAVKSDCANLMPNDKSFSENASPRYTQDVKHGTHILSTKHTSSFSKPASPYKEPRQITSISACMYTPGPKSPEIKGHPTVVKHQMKDHNTPVPNTEQQARSLSSADDKTDLKDAKQSVRFFRSQSERPKLDRNRGNQKLPVGIAVARQRQHTTPTKPRAAVKSRSPDLERRYHEHTLNQEREVLLRENKELSNYTSRLQTSTTNPPSLSMLNLPNTMLPGAWEREQAMMSSLLQWQQTQSSLLGSNLPHPSMWLGGTPPYHLPGNHAGSALASAQSSTTSGYPLLSNGLSGGFVIMPQLLQDPSAASMWSSLASLYQNAQATPTSFPNPFHNLLSQRLNLPHHELQAIQQRAMLHRGIPFPLHKDDGSLPDTLPLASSLPFASQLQSPDGDRLTHTPCRIDPSLKNSRRGPTPNWQHGERRQRSPLRSPAIQQKISHSSGDKSQNAHVKSDNIVVTSVIKGRHSELEHPKSRVDLNQSHQSTQILDLMSSPEDYSSVHTAVKAEKDNVKYERTSPTNPISNNQLSKEETKPVLFVQHNLNHEVKKLHTVTPSLESVSQIAHENVSETAETKLQNMPAKEDFQKRTKPSAISGVELLSQAADIHSQNMNNNTQPLVKGKHPVRPSPHPARLLENTESNHNKMVKKGGSVNSEMMVNSKQEAEEIDVTTLDPDVLDAVRGIALLSQSFSQRKLDSVKTVGAEGMPQTPVATEQNQFDTEHYREPHPSVSDCNDDVQSTVSFSSITDSAVISGDCLSSTELKDQETCKKVRLKRKLKKPISSKLKLAKDDGPITGATFKLDSMDAKEIDMKMRLADLQRRYKEKQKELAKIQRRNKKEKHDSNNTHSSSISVNLTSGIASSPYSAPKFKFGEKTPLSAPTPKKVASPTKPAKLTISRGMFPPKRKRSADNDKGQPKSKVQVTAKPPVAKMEMKTLFEKFTPDILAIRKTTKETMASKEDIENEAISEHQPIPSGSRKRKPEKPKRICLPPGEASTVPLVEPSKKNLSTLVNIHEECEPSSPDPKAKKKRKRKMKNSAKKIKLQAGDEPATSSWVFKSKNKSEKHESKIRKKSEGEKTKSQKSQNNNANLSNNNNKRKKPSISKEKVQPVPSLEPDAEKQEITETQQLELREEDLVKGLQVLVPLEDKLLYLCQINPIQPPDIYEVTVEGERHRHRPIVMCLEQILKEAVPDIKPQSAQDLCEGSRVAAYWSHKMHCLYTGTIAFDDSDDEDGEKQEGMVQVEFDDGDSSMIPLDDIRLLPRNYPIMQPDAPFMMHYVHRRRNTSEISAREPSKSTQSRVKKSSNQGQDRKEEKQKKKSEKSTSKSQKSALDLSGYGYPSADDVDQAITPMPRKRAASLKANNKSSAKATAAESSTSSLSSAEEDSDTVFSDSSDDTYEGDDGDTSVKARILPKYKNRGNLQNPSNELWAWHDKDVQKKAVKGKAKKIYHKSIRRGDEVISCGDSAVFLSAGRLYLPYIGRIESMWESWGNNMVVKVRWFYHPEETKRGRLKSHGKHPLYKSSHIDENDVQTISHKCEVVSYKEYCRRMRNAERNVFYCAGTYEPSTGQVIQEHTDKRKHQKS